jgi:uncharacterized protein (TIGR03083 family)
MEYEDHVRAVRREADALVTALAAGPLDALVPSCPQWTVADLSEHVGTFAGWWAAVLAEGTGRPKRPGGMPAAVGERVDWCAAVLDHLVGELEATPPDTEIWTWIVEDDRATFAARRAANELAIHRFDAQLARGTQQPIDAALAADGIDEIFVMVANRGAAPGGGGATFHLHATDVEAEWLVRLDADRVLVTHEHAKADAAVRGAVSDIELYLYRRPVVGEVDQFGGTAPFDAFYRAFEF